MIHCLEQTYGRASQNRLAQAHEPGVQGAGALLESFYFAFNQRNISVFSHIWAPHELIQLNNPLGGILHGYENILGLYQKIFSGTAKVWVEFSNIVVFSTGEMVVFAGRETGEFVLGDKVIPLSIRTSRIVQWMGTEIGWRQTHHHGSIDDPRLLDVYQRAVRGT